MANLDECPKCHKMMLSQLEIREVNSGRVMGFDYKCLGCGYSDRHGCFPGDAKIVTPNGLVQLDSLRAGDLVTSWQESTRTWVSRSVKKIISYGLAAITHLDLSDGSIVRVTDHHTIHTLKGWRRVGSLREGDCITSGCGELSGVRVLRIRRTGERVPVYNLHCEGEFNFVADGVVAHSFTTLRATRVALNRIADRIRGLLPAERYPIPKASALRAVIKAEMAK